MNDRELLELAARAAGIKARWFRVIKWTHLSRQISSGFKLNPLLLLQPNGAAPMRPGWKDFRPGQS
ncbi:hypothetical protein, partial [Pseudomonas aeruginosa]|uniref:hypothetical protein n=1 Tax=Pseudomonas aeruginosa TaxID=287 RepID=UPI00197F1F20